MDSRYDVIIVGGGAAGFFAAALLRAKSNLNILILESAAKILQKVRISGGGRCNISHDCRDPEQLASNYPRGHEVLAAVFQRYGPSETLAFFNQLGVRFKTEKDGRIFPVTDSSETIIEALHQATVARGVRLRLQHKVSKFRRNTDGWEVHTNANDQVYHSEHLIIASGSNKSIWQQLSHVGHHIIDPVPSLFTFNVASKAITKLSGITVPSARIVLPAFGIESEGPVLITHWGLSGPAVLKASAWAARDLHHAAYKYDIQVDWLPAWTEAMVLEYMDQQPKQAPKNAKWPGIPQRLWEFILTTSGAPERYNWAEMGTKHRLLIARRLKSARFMADGKTTFKEEFVTAGGVDLNEVNLTDFKSKLLPGLYLAGEVLNIDAVTGGFNFQAAWSGAGHIAQSILKS